MDAITLSQVLETLQRIGAPNPLTASQGDLFSFLKQLEEYVNEMESRLGVSADRSADATIFGRLSSVLERIDNQNIVIGSVNPTVAGTDTLFNYLKKLDNLLGTTGAAAGTSSVFARLAQIAGYVDAVEGYVDTVESSLGQTGDAANSAGSVHAKLKDLKTNGTPVVKSVQRGTYNFGTNKFTNLTISAVNLSKSTVNISNAALNDEVSHAFIRGRLTSTTNVELGRHNISSSGNYASGYEAYVAWEVIEFY